MREMSAVSMLLFLGVGMLGCNAAKQADSTAPASTSMTTGAWVVTINNFIGERTDTVTVVNPYPNGTLIYDGSGPAVGYTSCDNDGLTYYNPPQTGGTPIVGPACFVALGGGCNGGCGSTPQSIASSNGTTGVLPLNFVIGVPTNPVPNASTFNVQYAEQDDSSLWQMDGTGTINNGTASGTWVCDSSTPACSGITGTFTATQQ
jgi:hypothetical protein